MPQPERSKAPAKRTLAYPLELPSGYGFIARNGHILQAPRFSVIQRLLLRDAHGRPLDNLRYFSVGEQRNGRLRYAIFDEGGRKHSDFLYDEVTAAQDLIIGHAAQRTQIYDATNGHILLDAPYKTIRYNDGMIVATDPFNPREKPLAIFTRNGRRVKLDKMWPTTFPIEYFSGLALVFDGANACYIDKNGRVSVQSPFAFYGAGNYGDVYPFNDAGCAAGRTKPKQGGRFGVIDRRNAFVIQPESPRIRQFMDGRFAVMREKEKKFALHNPKGGKQTEARYTEVYQEDFDFLSAKEGEHFFLLDKQGAPIAIPALEGYSVKSAEPVSATAISVVYESRSGQTMSGLLGLRGEWIIEPAEYERVTPYCLTGGKAYYKAILPGNARCVLLDASGASVTQPYESLNYLAEDVSRAFLAGFTYLIDLADHPLWKSRPEVEPKPAKEEKE